MILNVIDKHQPTSATMLGLPHNFSCEGLRGPPWLLHGFTDDSQELGIAWKVLVRIEGD